MGPYLQILLFAGLNGALQGAVAALQGGEVNWENVAKAALAGFLAGAGLVAKKSPLKVKE